MLSDLDESAAAISEAEEKQFEDKSVQTGEDAKKLVQISVTLPEVFYFRYRYTVFKLVPSSLGYCRNLQ